MRWERHRLVLKHWAQETKETTVLTSPSYGPLYNEPDVHASVGDHTRSKEVEVYESFVVRLSISCGGILRFVTKHNARSVSVHQTTVASLRDQRNGVAWGNRQFRICSAANGGSHLVLGGWLILGKLPMVWVVV